MARGLRGCSELHEPSILGPRLKDQPRPGMCYSQDQEQNHKLKHTTHGKLLLRSDICHTQPHSTDQTSQRPVVTTDPARIVPYRECWKPQVRGCGVRALEEGSLFLEARITQHAIDICYHYCLFPLHVSYYANTISISSPSSSLPSGLSFRLLPLTEFHHQITALFCNTLPIPRPCHVLPFPAFRLYVHYVAVRIVDHDCIQQ